MIWTYLFLWVSCQIQSIASVDRPAWVQNALQSLSLRASFWEGASAGLEGVSFNWSLFPLPFFATFVHARPPRVVITRCVIGVHPIVLSSATPMIACAPKIIFAVHLNFALFLCQSPSCNSVRILFEQRGPPPSPPLFESGALSFLACITRATTCLTWFSSLACSSAT